MKINTTATVGGRNLSAVLYHSLSKLATWDGQNGPCFCEACDYRFGPEKHRHSAECSEAREALAIATGQHDSFIVAGHAWNYGNLHFPRVYAFSGVRRYE